MEDLRTDRLDTRKTGHVYIRDHGDSIRWMILHGYAQAPEDLLDSFPERKGHRYIAPEGFSRFYRKGFDGEVVSSWMTSKHRLDEIEDQKNWMDQVYDRYLKSDGGHRIAFAYSQGTATLFRWLADRPVAFDQLWIWAGSIPEDISYANLLKGMDDPVIHFFQGTEDPFLSENYLIQCAEWASDLGITSHTHLFEGGHRVLPDVLKDYMDQLIGHRASNES